MSDAFVFPCTKLPKRSFWKSRPNYSLEYAGGAFKQRVALDFESIPDYPHDRAQWMSSQIQFQLPNPVEPVSPFSMSSALPLLKANSSSADVKSVTSSERANTSTNPVNLSYTGPDASDYLLGGRGYAAVNHDPFGLPAIPELSWSARLSAAEADNGHSNAGSHVHLPDTNEEDDSFTHSNPVPVLIPGGPGSNSSTHSGLTSDSAPRTPPMQAQSDYFVTTHAQPDGYSHEAYPAAPHSYLSSPSTLYLRDSWGQFVLDAQSHYVSAAGSTHNTELRSNKPPSTIEERGEKWAGEVPNVWSLFSTTPTSGAMQLPPTPPVPGQPQSQSQRVPSIPVPPPFPQTQTLTICPIFAHILWDIRYPPASAAFIASKSKSKARTLTDPDSWTRGLSQLEVDAPATYPPKSSLLISSPHTRWRARVESEGGEYVSVADVLHALHDQLSLRFVKQSEWDKLDANTRWYVSRAYGRNRLDDPADADADAGSMKSGFSGAASVWSEGSRMSGESVLGGPGAGWGEGVRRADVLRDRTIFAGLRVDPAYKRKRRVPGDEEADESLLVMELRKVERPASMTSI